MPLVEVVPARAPVRGAFEVPPSKSIHQRALALAVLAEGTTEISARGRPAGDVLRLAAALSALAGDDVPALGRVASRWGEEGLGGHRRSASLDLGMNATGFRIALALSALRPAGARTHLGGAPRLRARPHRPLAAALERLGARVKRRHSGAYRVVARALAPVPLTLDARASSQYATALLLAAPRFGGLRLHLVGDPVSDGYLRLTLEALAAFGVPASREGAVLSVEGGAPRGTRVRVEPDASSAAAWWAAAALTGGEAFVPGLPAATSQPDAALLPILSRMGASVSARPSGEALVRGPADGLVGAGDVDLRDAPDLAPLVAALAAGAAGLTRVVGAPHLALKESNRIATCVAAVRALGGNAEPAADGFAVHGRTLCAGRVDAAGDHRIAIAFGVLGLAVPGIALLGADASAKSWPGFLDDLARVGAGATAGTS